MQITSSINSLIPEGRDPVLPQDPEWCLGARIAVLVNRCSLGLWEAGRSAPTSLGGRGPPHSLTAAWAPSAVSGLPHAGVGLLPGCRRSRCSRKRNIIHQGDKAADERWASEQLFLSSGRKGCWGSGGWGGWGKAHFEIKNDGTAGG